MFGCTNLPVADHIARPWRIHEIAEGFRVLDVWRLPTAGGPHDFPRLVELVATFDPAEASPVLHVLFGARRMVGRMLGFDDPPTGLTMRVPRVASLRDRLPRDLGLPPTAFGRNAFTPLYATDDEVALEIANQTVHGVMHIGWVPNAMGGYRGQRAVLVRPDGVLGRAYLAAIAPLRHLVVYPLMTRDLGRAWQQSAAVAGVRQ